MMRSPQEKEAINDTELLAAFAKADSSAIAYIYKNYFPLMSSYVCNNGGSKEDARDVFQEALMAIFKQVKSKDFVLTASFKTYIFAICRFQWLKNLRKNKRIESLPEMFDIQDLDDNIIVHLEKAERYNLLQKHLDRFKGNNRKILELYFQKFSTDEISEELGLSRAYVKKKKFECKKQLIGFIKTDTRFKEYIND